MNLRTLNDFKKQSEPNKDKKNTSSYTGGESSGMAVINPDLHQIMQKAEQNSKTPEEFEKEEKGKDANVCKITLFENGFIVDDGQFRNYEDPKNKQFMKELNKGNIPKSLREKYPKGSVSVSLSDKTSEKYVPPPPPPYTSFSGQGTSLSEPSIRTNTFAKKGKAPENYILIPSQDREITTIRVRLSNGTTITIEANLSTTLSEVYNHISTVSGVSQFQLFGGFPPKPLDLNSTVESSDLAGATLIQK